MRLSIDIGGTFTDLVTVSDLGDIAAYKTLTTKDPAMGVFDGLNSIAEDLRQPLPSLLEKVNMIIHSTTITTNALVTGQYEKAGLLVTKGFRDILEQRRGYKEGHLYDNKYPPPVCPVPRHLRIEISERINSRGEVLEPLNPKEVESAIQHLRSKNVKAVAISFLHSYKNPKHEREVQAIVEKYAPEFKISISHEIIPQYFYYERMATTIFNVVISRIFTGYLTKMEDFLRSNGFKGRLLIMQSNGGMMSTEFAKSKPCLTIASGPAAGAVAAAEYGRFYGDQKNCIGLDMGGTTSIVTMVNNGQPATSTENEFNRQRLLIPMVETNTIGAGGGSVAWIDPGGILRVGPQSATSNPGPACYSKGGVEPTVTDADLLLGFIDPNEFWGGRMKLDPTKAEDAIKTKLSDPLGIDVTEAAVGIYKVVNSNMTLAVKEISMQKGQDPRNYLLVVGGGAGPLHICHLMKDLDIRACVIPRESGGYASLGMLLSEVKHDYVRSYYKPDNVASQNEMTSLFTEMLNEGNATLTQEGIEKAHIRFEFSVDMQYAGQHHEISVPVKLDQINEEEGYAQMRAAFHKKHDELFGYSSPSDTIIFLNLRCVAIGSIQRPQPKQLETRDTQLRRDATMGMRAIYDVTEDKFANSPLYDFRRLGWGSTIMGPGIIQHPYTEIVIGSGFQVLVGKFGDFIMYHERNASEFKTL